MALRARRTSPRRSPAACGEGREPCSLVCALLPLTRCWENPALATCGGCILVAEFFAFHAEQSWLLRRQRGASPAASEQRGKGKSLALFIGTNPTLPAQGSHSHTLPQALQTINISASGSSSPKTTPDFPGSSFVFFPAQTKKLSKYTEVPTLGGKFC